MTLTSDTAKAFKTLFCEYKSLRKKGFTKEDSRKFTRASIYEIPAFSDWLHPDIDCALDELRKSGCIKCDITGKITISDEGIKYMEAQPKEFFKELSHLFDLASLFV